MRVRSALVRSVAAVTLLSLVTLAEGIALRVTSPNKIPYEAEIIVADKQVREVRVTLKPASSSGLPTWAWIAGGAVFVSGMTVGGYFLFRKTDSTYEGPTGNLNPGIIQASHPIRF